MSREPIVTAPEGRILDLSSVGGTAQRIEDAALDLFFERGFKSTTMRDIAAACGITAGALYNHFVSKDQLLSLLISRVHADLERSLVDALAAADGDPRVRLASLARAHALVHTRYRKDARVANAEIFSLPEPDRSEIVTARRRMRAMFEDVIHDGIAAGVFIEVDVFVVTVAILNMGIHIADWFHPGNRLSAEEVAEMHAELSLRMVGAR